MATGKSKIPEYMNLLLEAQVYEENRTCRKHVRRYENVFCPVCLQFECEKCWKDSKRHEDHRSSHWRVYEVHKGRSAVHMDDMEKLNWGGSRIELHHPHGNDVICLNPDEKPVETQEPYDGKVFKCLTCHNNLRKSIVRYFGFCSVLCKKRMIENTEAMKAERAKIKDES